MKNVFSVPPLKNIKTPAFLCLNFDFLVYDSSIKLSEIKRQDSITTSDFILYSHISQRYNKYKQGTHPFKTNGSWLSVYKAQPSNSPNKINFMFNK